MKNTAASEQQTLLPCRVLIADDSTLVRAIVTKVLRADEELKTLVICGEAVDGNDTIAKVKSLHPDIVLLDLSLPGINGLDVVRSLRAENASCTFVLMSEQELPVLESIAALAEIDFCVAKMMLGKEIGPLLKEVARLKPCSVA